MLVFAKLLGVTEAAIKNAACVCVCKWRLTSEGGQGGIGKAGSHSTCAASAQHVHICAASLQHLRRAFAATAQNLHGI